MKFEKKNRLRKRKEFLSVGKQGKKITLKNFIVLVVKNNTQDYRLGITVTKKVGNSPARNKIKRYVREVVRQYPSPGFDFVFIAKRGGEFTYKTTLEDYFDLLRKLV